MTSTLFRAANNRAKTGNNAEAFASTLNPVLDLFSGIGSARGRDMTSQISKSYTHDRIATTLVMFNTGDIRGGHGERQLFKDFLKWLANNDITALRRVLRLIPEYSRWDVLTDLLEVSTISNDVVAIVSKQLMEDLDAEHPSLLAKWMPSENASNRETKRKAVLWCLALGLTVRDYRKMLTTLRKKIRIVESMMSAKEFGAINYEHVPSKASKKYRKAFRKRDEKRYLEYLASVEKGEKKINASTLYPYEIIRAAKSVERDQTLEAQWKALPNYFDTEENVLVCPDVSGSMSSWTYYGTGYKRGKEPAFSPMDVAVSLAIYAAERNNGKFKNQFITFTDRPTFVEINPAATLRQKWGTATRNVGYNTNIQAVFDAILKVATMNKLPESEMPSKVFILSDMQFDDVGGETTNYQAIENAYARAGYKMPRLIFWRIANGADNQPVTQFQENVFLVSGFGPTMFKAALSQTAVNPTDLMNEVIYSERYQPVLEALS